MDADELVSKITTSVVTTAAPAQGQKRRHASSEEEFEDDDGTSAGNEDSDDEIFGLWKREKTGASANPSDAPKISSLDNVSSLEGEVLRLGGPCSAALNTLNSLSEEVRAGVREVVLLSQSLYLGNKSEKDVEQLVMSLISLELLSRITLRVPNDRVACRNKRLQQDSAFFVENSQRISFLLSSFV